VRFQDRRRNFVVRRYGAMHSEYYGLLLCRKIRFTRRALQTLNTRMGPVNHVGHDCRMISRHRFPRV